MQKKMWHKNCAIFSNIESFCCNIEVDTTVTIFNHFGSKIVPLFSNNNGIPVTIFGIPVTIFNHFGSKIVPLFSNNNGIPVASSPGAGSLGRGPCSGVPAMGSLRVGGPCRVGFLLSIE